MFVDTVVGITAVDDADEPIMMTPPR